MAGEVTVGTWERTRVPIGVAANTDSRVSQIATAADGAGLRRGAFKGAELEVFIVAGVSDAETWISNIPNIVAVAWQPDVANTDEVGVTLIDQATGEVEFSVGAGSPDGWIWVLRGK